MYSGGLVDTHFGKPFTVIMVVENCITRSPQQFPIITHVQNIRSPIKSIARAASRHERPTLTCFCPLRIVRLNSAMQFVLCYLVRQITSTIKTYESNARRWVLQFDGQRSAPPRLC